MATPFIRFPGGAGNNVQTEDTNILESDQGNLQQANGWRNNGNLGSFILSTALTPEFGDSHGEATTVGTGFTSAVCGGGTSNPVSAGTQYAYGAYVSTDQVGRVARLVVRWFDAGASNLGNSEGAFGPIAQNAWTFLEGFPVAPVGAAFSRQAIEMQTVAGAGEKLYWDAVVFREGLVSTFVPSLNIVGTSFLTEDASVTPVTYTYTPGSPLVLGDGYTGDVIQWALHDGADASAPIVAQALTTDALRALPL